MLVAGNVCVRFGSREVLSNVSLAVPQGMITGLLGPSGCGKSSLLSLLAGLESPQGGGVRTLMPSSRRYTSAIGVVFQKLALWPHLTLAENILFARRFHDNPLSTTEISHYVDTLGIGSVLKQYPSQASLGEQQRVALVRALAIRPQYLLLDEPTSALDDASAHRVEEILLQRRGEGVGILLVSHDRSLADRVADQVYCIRNHSVTLVREPENSVRIGESIREVVSNYVA